MKKLSIIIKSCFCLILLGVILFLPAYAQGEPISSKLPSIIGIACGGGTEGMGPNSYLTVMEKWLGVPARTVPSDSRPSNITTIKEGRAVIINDWKDSNAAIANEGRLTYASLSWGPQKTVFLWHSSDVPFGIMVRGDSPMKTLTAEEIKGKRLAYYKGSPMVMTGIKACLAFAGLTMDDVKVVEFGGYAHCARAVSEKRADMAFVSCLVGALSLELLEKPGGIRHLAMPLENKEAWERFSEIDPAGLPRLYGPEYGPEGQNTVIHSDIGVPVISYNAGIGTLLDVDEDIIYQLCRFYDQAYDEYVSLYKNNIQLAREKVIEQIRNCSIPYHPGAVKYFKEIGIWTDDDEKWNNERLAVFDLYEAAWDQAVAEAKKKNVKVYYTDEEWIKLWNTYLEKLPRFTSRKFD